MKRVGLTEKITQFLPVETMLPAVGQGALGLQIRKDDADLVKICARMNDTATAAEVAAERSFLRGLGGGCLLPIAALGKLDGQKLSLEGMLAAPNGTTVIREKISGTIKDAEEMGKKLAEIILEKGGTKLLDLMC
jgi:hydroxymethylbilane synthase